MNWISNVMFAGWLTGLVFYGTRASDHTLGEWKDVSAWAYVNVINHTPDSIPVGTIAPKVDRIVRLLGWVPAHDSAFFRLPYSDTVILLLVNNGWLPMDVKEPSVHRVEVWPFKGPIDTRGEP